MKDDMYRHKSTIPLPHGRGSERHGRGSERHGRVGGSHCRGRIHGKRASLGSRRRASSYVYFLSTSILVLVIGLSALYAARIERRSADAAADAALARSYAQSAIEIGLGMIAQDSTWRTNPGPGSWFLNQAIGTGRMSLAMGTIADADADLSNNPVILWGTGNQGSAIQRYKVKLVPATTNGGMVIDEGGWMRESIGVPPWIIFDPTEPVLEAL